LLHGFARGWKLKGIVEDFLFYLRGYAVTDPGRTPGFLKETLQSFLLNSGLDIIVVLTTYAQFPTSFADIAKGSAQLQNVELTINDILSLSHDPSSFG
jgi:hypothetical protein